MKSKGEKERYKHLNAEFQRIARRDKKAFSSDQCKERGKRAHTLKVPEVAVAKEQLLLLGQGRKTGRESFFPELGWKPLQKGHTYHSKNTQKNYTKKIFTTNIIMMV